jgi:YjbE family integral membrane protein
MEQLLFGLLELILLNIVLSGDNAVVIAMACRNLPQHQQKKAIFWGSVGAILLRVVLTFVAVWLLKIPFVQLLGGILLIYIAIKLLKGENESEHLKTGSTMSAAIKTIIIADLVMSLDNVLALAGAAMGNYLLIALGLAISVPLIIWGSQLLMTLMNRFPVIIWAGAALLGFTAGEMIDEDQAIHGFLETFIPLYHLVIPIGLAVFVLVVGKWLNKRREAVTPLS